MRDPNRIDKFCDELKTIWHKVPDWRFGQFIVNMDQIIHIHYDKDMFYIEDDDMLEIMKDYFKEQENA